MDRDLVEGAIAGDREAYTELVRQSIDRSYALAGLILRDPDRARDATQEAYVTAWRGLSSLRDPSRFDAWLRRLVVRACYQAVRGEAQTPPRRHRRDRPGAGRCGWPSPTRRSTSRRATSWSAASGG